MLVSVVYQPLWAKNTSGINSFTGFDHLQQVPCILMICMVSLFKKMNLYSVPLFNSKQSTQFIHLILAALNQMKMSELMVLLVIEESECYLGATKTRG